LSDRTTGDPGLDDTSVEPGVWRYAKASRARVIIDADNYFDYMQQAMLKARHRVLLIGWDFDTRIHLSKGRRWWQKGIRRTYPSRLGSFVLWLARHRTGLEIRILKWGFGVWKFAGRGSMAVDLLRWLPHRRIDFKFDTAHPIACCHHQKIAVIDGNFAVCGGIDMTTRRWDTRAHLEDDRRRTKPGGQPHGPWHDLTMVMEGEIGEALEELGHDRWIRAGGKPLKPARRSSGSAWPDALLADFENVEIGIARTRAAYRGAPEVHEVEQLFLRQIAEAKHFIYAENQYFASRNIAEAIAARLIEENPPEIVIVHPATADGWVESRAMDPARARLAAALRHLDEHDRFHLYVPYTGETPIYVHAKIMIVDDHVLRVGSANFNNRSLGLDSECDVFIDCARSGNEHCFDRIRHVRHSLLAEHCGLDESHVAELIEKHGSMAGMIASLGIDRRRTLRPFHPPPLSEWEIELADREMLDPEEPAELFDLRATDRGLFRRGSLLARSMRRLKRRKLKT
jgi:phosphatidylserine/phosphatidylglycerophosphate/cardiolipin synthase-like enzyme